MPSTFKKSATVRLFFKKIRLAVNQKLRLKAPLDVLGGFWIRKLFGDQFRGRGSAGTPVWPARTDSATRNTIIVELGSARIPRDLANPSTILINPSKVKNTQRGGSRNAHASMHACLWIYLLAGLELRCKVVLLCSTSIVRRLIPKNGFSAGFLGFEKKKEKKEKK